MPRFRPAHWSLLALSIAACGEELPGSYFEITLETAKDQASQPKDDCNDPPETVKETYEYRVVLEGADARVYIGEDLLATGTLDVCTLSYQTTTWQDRRDEGYARWAIVGQAQVELGSGCDAGWTGTERIEVVESTDPTLPSGCRMELDASGELARTVDP